jgi:hypothetical protein
MKTTNEGFLVNTLRRLPRHGVKALAAGAVLIAAALPLAVASAAGATDITAATVSFNTQFPNYLGSQSGGNPSFGTGASGLLTLSVGSSSDFANNNSTIALSTNAPGVTFSSVTETGQPTATTVTAKFASTSATVAGTYDLTFTDGGGASTDTAAFSVNPPPSETSISPAPTMADGASNSPTTFTLNGSGFEAPGTNGGNINPTAIFTSQVDGTTLRTTGAPTGNTTITSPGAPSLYNGTALSVGVYSQNSVGGNPPATVGAYTLTIINGDGGTVSIPNAFSITGASITNLSPSAFPSSIAAPTVSVSILGSGFQQGAAVTFPGCGEIPGPVSTTYNSPTSLTASFVQNLGSSLCNVVVTNPAPAAGNGAVATLTGGLGFGTASTVAPTITATSDTTPIVPGAPSGTITLTGTGFSSQDLTTLAKDGNGNTANGVTISAPSGNTGTSITYTLSIASSVNTVAGADSLSIEGSAAFPAAILIAGPVIASQTPVDIPVGSPVGTIVTLTGTGFTPTVTGTVYQGSVGGSQFNGNVNYVNATTIDVVITTTPTIFDSQGANPAHVIVHESLIGGSGTAESATYDFVFGASPTISGIVYKAGTTGIGAGAVAQTATITGTNFKTGVVVGSFKNVNSVADAGVTAKVVSINAAGTAITVSFAIAATDTNTLDSFAVTNTDGGTAVSPVALIIQPAPTVTAVAPATAAANTTDAFTITGTNFGAGATVTATADGTCGAATVVSATSITVTCTFGASTATAAALLVTNANGGVATSAAIVPATSAPVAPAPHATGEAGSAIIGRTVNIAVAGVGFYGQPSVTSTGNSVKAVVSHDNGTLLTVVVTVGKTTGPGEHTLTFTLANGSVFKVNYAIIK